MAPAFFMKPDERLPTEADSAVWDWGSVEGHAKTPETEGGQRKSEITLCLTDNSQRVSSRHTVRQYRRGPITAVIEK